MDETETTEAVEIKEVETKHKKKGKIEPQVLTKEEKEAAVEKFIQDNPSQSESIENTKQRDDQRQKVLKSVPKSSEKNIIMSCPVCGSITWSQPNILRYQYSTPYISTSSAYLEKIALFTCMECGYTMSRKDADAIAEKILRAKK